MNRKYFMSAISVALAAAYTKATGHLDPGVAFGAVSAVGYALLPKRNRQGAGLLCDGPDLVKLVEDALGKVKSATERLEGEGKEYRAKFEAGEKLTEQYTGKVDDAIKSVNELRQELADLGKQVASNPTSGRGGNRIKSPGEQIVAAEGFKAFAESGSKTSIKATIDTTAAGGMDNGGSGLMTPIYRDGDLVSLPRRPTLESLFNTVQVNSAAIEYAIQLTRNNNSAPVAESASKPYSDYSWGSKTVNVKTLAHLAKLTRQALDDAPRLVGEVNSEMLYGLDLTTEAQLLFGNGTGQNLDGLVPQATQFALPAGFTAGSLTKIDILRLSILNITLRLWRPDGIVINTGDWASIEMAKDSQERYLIANPMVGAIQQLWRLPVVDSPVIPQDTFLVGAFAIGATLYNRMGTEVLISTENGTDFEENLATMRVERRLALAVKRPGAFDTGTFTAANTAPATGGGG